MKKNKVMIMHWPTPIFIPWCKLTKSINFVLIFSMISSRYLYSWLVSKTRISITDFDDDFFTGETFFIIIVWWSTPFPLTETLAPLLEDKWFWRESWNSDRAVEKWLWVCLTLYCFWFPSKSELWSDRIMMLIRYEHCIRLLIWKKMLENC